MHDQVTVRMNATPDDIWALISDITNTGRFSPETFEAEWLGGTTAPAVGAKFRGHVRRNGRGPVYWTTCRITSCDPGRAFGFAVEGGKRDINNWLYELAPSPDGGTDVTESFALNKSAFTKVYWAIAGKARGRYNQKNMQQTLERIKEAAEHEAGLA
jgi:hypothetical protein